MTYTSTPSKVVNLTPHPLVLNGVTIESSGVARCKTIEKPLGHVGTAQVIRVEFGAVENLPDPQDNTVFVVSSITAQACTNRPDVFVPARPIRDDKGNIIGCAALATMNASPVLDGLEVEV